MNEVGRPSELTEELTLKIRQGVLEDKLYKDIQAELDVSPNTWDTWVYKDYKGFRDNLIRWNREKMFKKAEKGLDELLDSDDERVKLQAVVHTTKTLGKEFYSDRVEHTGKNGEAIEVKQITGMQIIDDNRV